MQLNHLFDELRSRRSILLSIALCGGVAVALWPASPAAQAQPPAAEQQREAEDDAAEARERARRAEDDAAESARRAQRASRSLFERLVQPREEEDDNGRERDDDARERDDEEDDDEEDRCAGVVVNVEVTVNVNSGNVSHGPGLPGRALFDRGFDGGDRGDRRSEDRERDQSRDGDDRDQRIRQLEREVDRLMTELEETRRQRRGLPEGFGPEALRERLERMVIPEEARRRIEEMLRRREAGEVGPPRRAPEEAARERAEQPPEEAEEERLEQPEPEAEPEQPGASSAPAQTFFQVMFDTLRRFDFEANE